MSWNLRVSKKQFNVDFKVCMYSFYLFVLIVLFINLSSSAT
jgi:hypothetical protein